MSARPYPGIPGTCRCGRAIVLVQLTVLRRSVWVHQPPLPDTERWHGAAPR